MRHTTQTLARLAAGACAVAAFATAAPSLAQTVDEITVMGRLGPDGRPETLSRAVPIGDLDLRYDGGVAEARARVRAAAHDICRELGETGGRSPIGASCEDGAVKSASDQLRVAVADARSNPNYAVAAVVPAPAPYAGPTAAEEDAAADAAAADASATVPDYSSTATVTTTTITNGAVPDTPENRARFGGPISNGGRQTAPRGN